MPDFRSAWEEMDESTELADSYGLGHRDSMQEAVEAVIAILGMQVETVCVQTVTPYMTCTLLVLQKSGMSQELLLWCNALLPKLTKSIAHPLPVVVCVLLVPRI